MNEVYGEQRASMDAVLGLKSLREDLAGLARKDQVLAIDLRDRDPELAFSDVPYEKGRLFLNFLDAKFGRERFDAFLRGYFDHFAFKSITTEQFNRVPVGESARPLSRHRRARASARLGECAGHSGRCRVAGVERLVAGGCKRAPRGSRARLPPRSSVSIGSRSSGCISWTACRQRCAPSSSRELDQAYGLTRSQNAEIEQRWLELVIRTDYRPGYARLEEYLKSVGRRRLIVPLYVELMKTPAGSEFAKRVYAVARPGLHPQTAAAIDAIVTPETAERAE